MGRSRQIDSAHQSEPSEATAADQPKLDAWSLYIESLMRTARLQLLTQFYIGFRVGLEGTYAAGLQIVVGGLTVIIGALAYVFFPNVPPRGRAIAILAVQPAAMIAIACALFMVMRPFDRVPSPDVSAGAETMNSDSNVDQMSQVVAEARTLLTRRESGLRWALVLAFGWVVISSAILLVLFKLEPNWLLRP